MGDKRAELQPWGNKKTGKWELRQRVELVAGVWVRRVLPFKLPNNEFVTQAEAQAAADRLIEKLRAFF